MNRNLAYFNDKHSWCACVHESYLKVSDREYTLLISVNPIGFHDNYILIIRVILIGKFGVGVKN